MALNFPFLGGLPEGLLNPEQQAQAQERAQQAAALQLGLGMIAGATGQRGAGKPGLAQIAAQAGPGAIQAYQGSFDQTLRNMLIGKQLADAKKKELEQERMREAIRGAYTTRPVAGLGIGAEQLSYMQPEIEAFGAEGIAPAAAMVAPTERVVDRQKLLSAIAEFAPEKYLELTQPKEQKLPGSYEEFQMAQRDPLFAQYLQRKQENLAPKVNVNDPTAVDREIREINKDFQKELKDRGMTEVADRFQFLQSSVSQALKGNTKAHGAIIYNLGKIYDPSGAVQEGDKQTIIGNRSIPEGVRAVADRVFKGGLLTAPEIRGLYENVLLNVEQRATVAEGIASGYKESAERLRPGAGKQIRSPFSVLKFDELPGGATVNPRGK